MSPEPTTPRSPTADPATLQQAWRRQWSRLGFAYHHLMGAQTILAGFPARAEGETGLWTALLCLLFEARDQGHLCLSVQRFAPAWAARPGTELFPVAWPTDATTLVDQLIASGLACLAGAAESCPLVITASGPVALVYFHGMHQAETRLVELVNRHHAQASAPAPEAIHQGLESWFNRLPPSRRPELRQAAAIHQALDQRLFILGGGPGTGKTTTVFHLLHGLFLAGYTTLALSAPTGRAAARLQESLARSLSELLDYLGDPADQAFVAWLGACRGMTLHRLLGQSGVFSEFASDTSDLPYDLVVVDEASMVDLDQMLLLLTRLPSTARLILVGDPDQLPSVGAGSILADLTASGLFPAYARLEHCFRSDTAILDCAKAVLSGRVPAPATAGDSPVRNFALGTNQLANGQRAVLIRQWASEQDIAGLAHACRWDAQPLAGKLAELYARASDSILLTALREGPWGVEALNAQVRDVLLKSGMAMGEWLPGMMAMVSRNDYQRGLYNGDRGLVCLVQNRPMVWFPDSAGDGGRWFSPFTIPGLEPAWALTVHKSQGSEYGAVWIFLGESASAESPVSRELLYTGMTRAKKRLVLATNPAAFAAACARSVERQSGIRMTER